MVVMFMVLQSKLGLQLQGTKITVVKKFVRIMRVFYMISGITGLGSSFQTYLTHELVSAFRIRIADD